MIKIRTTELKTEKSARDTADQARDTVSAALQNSENRYRRLFESANDGILILDADTGKVLDVNPFLLKLLGYSYDELFGKYIWEIGFFKDVAASKDAFKALQDNEYIRYEDLPLETCDGCPIAVEFISNVCSLARGNVIQCNIRDITMRKRAEMDLEKQARKLEEAHKELESFSYSVSHDLRAPLRAIEGYSRIILRKHAEKFDKDVVEKFNAIMDNTRMMGQLIEDLLALSRFVKVKLSIAHVDMKALFGEIWNELVTTNPNRRLTLKIAEFPPCMGDRGLIRQVLVNLISNAIKYTGLREEAIIEVGGEVKGNEILYYIRDNGVGFDMRFYDKLFGVFQRLHSNTEFEGTGVGLAIVLRIINRHGGRIWAEGEVDKGAIFYFTLPKKETN